MRALITVAIVAAAAVTWAAEAPKPPAGQEVLASVRRYVATYRPQLAELVAEERYTQQVTGARTGQRSLAADWALIRSDDGVWSGFRDVWEVDGRPVPERQRRLDALVGRGRPDAALARRIIEESARYNLSGRVREFNSPHVGLELLAPERDWCCAVHLQPMPGLDPARWMLDVQELVPRTLIRTREGRWVPITARYVVDETTGAVRWYELKVGTPDPVVLQVTFTWHDQLGRWLPAELLEEFGRPRRGFTGQGRAAYTNWRRFGVETRLLPVP